MQPPSLLGGLSPTEFMRRYWHRQPLLIRQAIPGFAPLLDRAALLALATRDDVESRLIRKVRQHWTLSSGPFEASELPSARARQWTLLLQGVNLHHDGARALLDQFRFVPDARLDDLMISYATDGGGVGPHFDSYDVFLLQAHGTRRWRISAQQDHTLIDGLPLKILKNFKAEQEWDLTPGDMLYLPPGYAHDGVALGECMTYSIGFRAPTNREILQNFLYFLAENTDELPLGRAFEGRYADPWQPSVAHPARLPDQMIDHIAAQLARVRWRRQDIARFLGQWLSEPKPQVYFTPPESPMARGSFVRRARAHGVVLARQSQCLYEKGQSFINGEIQPLPGIVQKWFRRLADTRRLSQADCAKLPAPPAPDWDILYEWYCAGWIELSP
ncbi:cupin [Pandoraea thiooxydans]|nr:cupin [Pandoraea thiooxydans]